MSAHTPGPWRVGITGHAVYQVAAPELRVALCSDIEDKGGRKVEQANARLIAAAPDLLEALKDAGDFVCANDCSQVAGRHSVTCERISAAIAKAEGK